MLRCDREPITFELHKCMLMFLPNQKYTYMLKFLNMIYYHVSFTSFNNVNVKFREQVDNLMKIVEDMKEEVRS